MHPALKQLFEAQLAFQQEDGAVIPGNVYLGRAEFSPVKTLGMDPVTYTDECNRWLDEVWHPDQTRLRNRLLTLWGNAGRYTDLLNTIQRDQLVPFIGSGMSVPSGFPQWSDLLREIQTYTTFPAGELEALLTSSQFEEAAAKLAENAPWRLFDERIEHSLRVEDPSDIQGPISLLPAVPHLAVITTNLDDVLEHVYTQAESDFSCVLAGADISRYRTLKDSKNRFLLKIHGDCRHSSSRVLTVEEYDSAYIRGGHPREELIMLFRNFSLLFLGCSLGPDRTVQLVQEIAFSDGHTPKHFTFLKAPNSDTERVQREHFLTERGIFPLWYDGSHDECITALLAGLLTTNGTA